MTNMNSSRTFCTLVSSRACANFGAVRYTLTETITERDGGLQVDTHASGMSEGERVDQRSSKFYPGVAMEAAASYRLRNGYHEIA